MANRLKDIADELGVSVSTVSRVANGKHNVSPSTEKLVKKALARHQYMPNQVARSLKKRSTHTIGVIVPDISDYFTTVVKGIDRVASQNGYSMILSDSNELPETEEKYLRLLFEKRIDGLVLATVSTEHKALHLYKENNVPVVYIDNLPNLDYGYDCVLIDNRRAGYMAVSHLLSCGHRNIAIITGSKHETTGLERLEGYNEALTRFGLPVQPELIKYGNYKEDAGYSDMMELLENRENAPFTAVFVGSFKMTCGAIAALNEKGLKIPDDISLMGFDFTDKTMLIQPKITTILQPEDAIGRMVAELLISRINAIQDTEHSNIYVPQRIMLDPILQVNNSCSIIRR